MNYKLPFIDYICYLRRHQLKAFQKQFLAPQVLKQSTEVIELKGQMLMLVVCFLCYCLYPDYI